MPKIKITKKQTMEIENLGTHTFQHFQNVRFSDVKNMFKDTPYFSCIFCSIFGDKYGVRGSRFSRFFEVPEIIQNVLQYVRESTSAILE